MSPLTFHFKTKFYLNHLQTNIGMNANHTFVCRRCSYQTELSWEASSHCLIEHRAAVGLIRYCGFCRGIVLLNPQHIIRHLNLDDIIIGGPNPVSAIFLVPISDAHGVHVDTFIGFSAIMIQKNIKRKMQMIEYSSEHVLIHACTGLKNYLNKPENKSLMAHPELIFYPKIYNSQPLGQSVKGLIREMVDTKSGNKRTDSAELKLYEPAILERLNIIKEFLLPNLIVKKFY